MENLSSNLIKKIKRVRLVATDLDGTLLNNAGQVTDTTRESVRKLKGLGIRIAIMTAQESMLQ